MKLVNLLLQYAKLRVEGSVSQAVAPIGPYLQKTGTGIACFVAALGIGLMCLFFLAMSLFFALLQFDQGAIASLWTSIALLIPTLALGFVGQSFLKTK